VSQTDPILVAKNIQKAFGANQVLKGVSLSVARGEVVSLIGARGSGKSTFLRCLNLLETPQEGELAIGRHHFEFGGNHREPGNAELALLRRDVGMVFQHFNLFPHRSALDNVIEGPVQVKNMAKAEARELGRDLLAKVGLADHLARHRLADLFLDTLPYNAHTTASDALWAGLPLVTCLGSTFAGRVSASLLRAAGLSELIATSLEDYEALALKLAHEPLLLAATKDKLARNRETCPLFDTQRFTRHIENAYLAMWQHHREGRQPADFSVGGRPTIGDEYSHGQ